MLRINNKKIEFSFDIQITRELENAIYRYYIQGYFSMFSLFVFFNTAFKNFYGRAISFKRFENRIVLAYTL
ncbi:hypothetical protein BpHYR1_053681 [Brachionus plicatilis]|uniref:Uncharacterized protein n=1 Tax=Brachionus plicatilis TaxID=10195 RepID=A0A3M7Q8H4_BRAPC|nr:hypothetical protein BpHYR1_053681 [Brachionus plicatilis]